MTTKSFSEKQFKDLVKQAILEIFEERKDLFYNLMAQYLEDIALVNAIREGETSYSVSREEVFKSLQEKP